MPRPRSQEDISRAAASEFCMPSARMMAGKRFEMLDDQPFHSAGGDEQDAEVIGGQLVNILIIYEIDGEIFLQLCQYYFMGTANRCLLM